MVVVGCFVYSSVVSSFGLVFWEDWLELGISIGVVIFWLFG